MEVDSALLDKELEAKTEVSKDAIDDVQKSNPISSTVTYETSNEVYIKEEQIDNEYEKNTNESEACQNLFLPDQINNVQSPSNHLSQIEDQQTVDEIKIEQGTTTNARQTILLK